MCVRRKSYPPFRGEFPGKGHGSAQAGLAYGRYQCTCAALASEGLGKGHRRLHEVSTEHKKFTLDWVRTPSGSLLCHLAAVSPGANPWSSPNCGPAGGPGCPVQHLEPVAPPPEWVAQCEGDSTLLLLSVLVLSTALGNSGTAPCHPHTPTEQGILEPCPTAASCGCSF